MTRFRLLRHLNNNGILASLTEEALRIFLMIVSCASEDLEGELSQKQILSVSRKGLLPENIKNACRDIEKKRLIIITSDLKEGLGRHSHISYRLVLPNPLKESRNDNGGD